jgi:hypothetical protein
MIALGVSPVVLTKIIKISKVNLQRFSFLLFSNLAHKTKIGTACIQVGDYNSNSPGPIKLSSSQSRAGVRVCFVFLKASANYTRNNGLS